MELLYILGALCLQNARGGVEVTQGTALILHAPPPEQEPPSGTGTPGNRWVQQLWGFADPADILEVHRAGAKGALQSPAGVGSRGADEPGSSQNPPTIP